MKNSFILTVALVAAIAAGNAMTVQAETGEKTNRPAGQKSAVPVKATVLPFQGATVNELAYRETPQTLTETDAKPWADYRSAIELRAPKPNNVMRSKKYLGVEYSGILVQLARNNPLQLINPFAPAKYGDGEVNMVRNPVTRRAEGLKVFQVSF